MRTLQYAVSALAVAATLALGGCGNEASDPADTTAEDTVSESTTASDSMAPSDSSDSSSASDPASAPPQVAQAAVADLAGMLDIDASDIEVVLVEPVTWRDGSIGCAEPGKMYTQALVAGQRVVLSAQGRQYEYHSGEPRGVFHCQKPTQ